MELMFVITFTVSNTVRIKDTDSNLISLIVMMRNLMVTKSK